MHQREKMTLLFKTGCLWRLIVTMLLTFQLQIVVNINKQHLNFVKRKTLDEIIKQKVGYLNQFTNISLVNKNPLY